jgi:ATP-dependent DNA helicase RecQ
MILEAIAAHGRPAPSAPRSTRAAPDKTNPATLPRPVVSKLYVPTEEWTWRLLDRGFNLEEAAAIRGLELAAIVRHATLMARKGQRIAIESYLSSETFQVWEGHRRRGETSPPPGSEESAGLFALFLACRATDP